MKKKILIANCPEKFKIFDKERIYFNKNDFELMGSTKMSSRFARTFSGENEFLNLSN